MHACVPMVQWGYGMQDFLFLRVAEVSSVSEGVSVHGSVIL